MFKKKRDRADLIRDDGRLAASSQIDDGAMATDLPQVAVSGPAVRCALCRMATPVEDGVLIPNRGVLCPGCIGEIEATIAETRQQQR